VQGHSGCLEMVQFHNYHHSQVHWCIGSNRLRATKCKTEPSLQEQTPSALTMTWRHMAIAKFTFACCFIWTAASSRLQIADKRGLADTPRALHQPAPFALPWHMTT
jgi:hypothetical protein